MWLCKSKRSACGASGITIGRLLMAVPILLTLGGMAGAAAKPMSVAELALYQGPDREKLFVEGARKEGPLTFYDTHTGFRNVVQEFEKKYPFIKVAERRSTAKELFAMVREEYAAKRPHVDVVNATAVMSFLQREGMLQEYYSPHLPYYDDEYKAKGKTGVYYMAVVENYIGLGFNTERVSPAEAPKNLKDLLDPKWKGKMSITGTNTGITWLGNALETMGRGYIEKLRSQDLRVQNISGAALAGLIVSGEVLLSPTIYNDNIFVAKKKKAPAEWRSLEPVVTAVQSAGITTVSPHPYAAMLFIDYLHSREGQKVVMESGVNSPRRDMGSPEMKFKKTIFDFKYSPEELEKHYNEWENLLRSVIVKVK